MIRADGAFAGIMGKAAQKLCVGQPWQFMAIVKAMIEMDNYPDFIIIDGAEGGTGAAPVEFMDNVGMPTVGQVLV